MKTVLIVDDSRDDVELAKLAINAGRSEVSVKVALSGESALNYLRNEEDMPTLILLDLKMCGMSGIETLRNIRADERLREIPVVVVTSSSIPSEEQEAVAVGANGYLHKVLDIKQFSKNMNSLLDRWIPN